MVELRPAISQSAWVVYQNPNLTEPGPWVWQSLGRAGAQPASKTDLLDAIPSRQNRRSVLEVKMALREKKSTLAFH